MIFGLMDINNKKPLIGFIAFFNNFGETSTLTTIAKKYIEQGGKAIFFGYGEKYQNLAKNIGCKVVILPEKFSDKELKKLKSFHKKVNKNQEFQEKTISQIVNKDFFHSDVFSIKNEIKEFIKNNVEMIVTGFAYSTNISARKVKIPLVYIISGAAIPPYYEQKLAKFPDNYRNFFINLFPDIILKNIANWYILNNKNLVKEFNTLATKFNTKKIKNFLDIFSGDYTLVAEDIEFINLIPTPEFPVNNFIGPIFPDKISVEKENYDEENICKHLNRPGKSILVTLGSSGTKELLFKILHALEKTDHNIIAIYTSVIEDNEIPEFKDNILLVKFVPSIKKINQLVDIAIIHGGRGTVYTAAYSGKPVIGIPMQIEQQCNIDNLVRHGAGVKISKRNFSSKKLLKAIDEILSNYYSYLDKAKLLKEKLPEQKGAENAIKRLLEIYEQTNK